MGETTNGSDDEFILGYVALKKTMGYPIEAMRKLLIYGSMAQEDSALFILLMIIKAVAIGKIS